MTYSFEDSLGFQVNKTANMMRSRFNQFLKPYALTAEQYVILKAINENAQVSPSQLADILSKDKTTITRMIETLVKNDFIQRQKHQFDRRSHTLIYTQKATETMSQILPVTDEIIGKIRKKFKPQELDCFLSVLSELRSIDCLEDL
jgi:DNA-binding MarR family transcriptional regulator